VAQLAPDAVYTGKSFGMMGRETEMKTSKANERPRAPARRRFIGLMAGLSAALATGLPSARARADALPLREADFYRPHDLAG
jgi:hypothetical protein